MSEKDLEHNNEGEQRAEAPGQDGASFSVSGMYKEWFLDYASYVILERAVPALYDGLKPVQRRILHAMKDLDDGRYNKVANIIGHAMQYHPHGDASIGDALVQLGQKDLLIDMQGNWGNTLTGDRAAAPRYIEARLSKFAHEVVFNPKTTEWQASYDGRNKEPVFLPVKFPLLLAQGGEGIAVGLSCKMLPHNFNELIDASIAVLRGKSFKLLPDFSTGGMADVSNYNDGKKGGRVRVRARIRKENSKTLVVHEIPWGTTTNGLIESILKANDKGKIKVKKIEDNTAAEAEIMIHLPGGVSPDKTIDALYAFTDCEMSIAPNGCVIENDKPRFVSVKELLKISTENTLYLLRRELEIRLSELQEQWHFASLERIFIENRIYRKIENAETWEEVMGNIHKGLKPHVKHLKREVTDEDVVRLTEIKIKRISKYDSFKADEHIKGLEDKLADVQHKLAHLIDHAIDYFKELKKKFGEGRERKTELRTFDKVVATKVAATNRKLYVDRKEGFIGYGMRGMEMLGECSDIDNIIVFRKDGRMIVTKIDSKKFVGKDILHAAVWKKGDQRTIYHMVYQDGTKGSSYAKRFAVSGITRDKEYDLTKGSKGSKVLYFSANGNGQSETVQVLLRQRTGLRKLKFELDFGDLAIKGRGARGNQITKHMISKVIQKEVGASTLGAREVWFDGTVRRLNAEGRGRYLGKFAGADKLLAVMNTGVYQLFDPQLNTHFPEEMDLLVKHDPEAVMSVVYFDGEKQEYKVKRFKVETSDRPVEFITEDEDSRLEVYSMLSPADVTIQYDKRGGGGEDEIVDLCEWIGVKGVKAKGNLLTRHKVKSFALDGPTYKDPERTEQQEPASTEQQPNVVEGLELDGPEAMGLEESPVQAYRRKMMEQREKKKEQPEDTSGYEAGSQITLELD